MKTGIKITLIILPIVIVAAAGITAGLIYNDNLKKNNFDQQTYDSFSLDVVLKNQLECKDNNNVNFVMDGNVPNKKDSDMKIYNLLIDANVELKETKYGCQKISFKGYAEKYAGTIHSKTSYGSYRISVSQKYTLLELEFDAYRQFDRSLYYKYYEVSAEVGKNVQEAMKAVLNA